MTYAEDLACRARQASRRLAPALGRSKNDWLIHAAESLQKHSGRILDANGADVANATRAQLSAANSRTSQEILRAYAHFGSKRRADGRIIWKRDPKIGNGFVPTDLWRFVRQIKAPTIYILGGRSTIVPAETQEQLRRTLPQVQIVTMSGLGHYPSEENAKDFLAIVDRFLAEK